MRRNHIGLIWLGGILLTLLLYQAGPEEVLQTIGAWVAGLQFTFVSLLDSLAVNTFQLVRALAIGLFPVFVALCVLAIRRGLQARRALGVVSMLFLLLLYGPVWSGDRISSNRWLGAFLLVSVGSAVMTHRLTGPARGTGAVRVRP